jgi:threonine dehydrogenase-like Zn-dependent dehydrogenase
MRAVVLREGRLEVRETPDPVPGPGELLVRTLSTGICASDVHFLDHPELVAEDLGMLYDAHRDIVLGHEFVGEVLAQGPDCSGQFPPGTNVTSMPILLRQAGVQCIGQHPDAPGSFGELFVLSEVMSRAVPEGATTDAVALVDAFAVGEFYVRSSGIEPGWIPLVVGAGAIGLSAVAALAKRNIEPIVVSDYNPERLNLAKTFGAHTLVNPAERSAFDAWREVARDRDSSTPPVIFECVGAPGLIQHIVESADGWARIYAAGGWYSGDTLSCTEATRKGVTIQFGGGPMPEDWDGTLNAVIEGSLDPSPAIGQVIGLDDVPAALNQTRLAQGPPRIVVRPNG